MSALDGDFDWTEQGQIYEHDDDSPDLYGDEDDDEEEPMTDTKPNLMVPPDVAHAIVRNRDYAEGHRDGMAEGAAAERARLVAVVRGALDDALEGGDRAAWGLRAALDAMGGGEEGSGG